MLHSGYVWGKQFSFTDNAGAVLRTGKMSGLPTGIGGALKFGFGKHLRIGCEGYVSTLTYDEHGSYSQTGWGGILADWIWTHKRWSWFIGCTFGGGSVRNTSFMSDTHLDFVIEDNTSFRHYGFAAVAPFAGVEFALTGKIHLTLKTDYLMNVSNPQADFVSGPRVYLGFMFCHPISSRISSGSSL